MLPDCSEQNSLRQGRGSVLGGCPRHGDAGGAAPAAGGRAGRPGQLLDSRLKYPVSLRQSGWVVVLVEELGAEDALPVYEGIGLPTAAAWGRGAVGGPQGVQGAWPWGAVLALVPHGVPCGVSVCQPQAWGALCRCCPWC